MSIELIRELRQRTGAGIMDCKNALKENDGNVDAAIDWLRTKGISQAAKKSGRIASEGLVNAYIHAGGKIGVLVEVNCETDFVALNEDFKSFVNDLCMHIAAVAPEYVSREEVPADAIEREKQVQKARVIEEGKPEHIADRIVEGRLGKFYEESCLLEQKFVKDDSKTIQDMVTTLVSTIGENIKVRRFTRYELGAGLEKRSEDFAAEVAAVTGSN